MSDNSSLSLSPDSQGYPEEEFIDDFLVEAQEYLERIEELILDLEVKPGDKEIINSLFRYFHTTKGLAGFIEQRDIQEIAHKIETIMEQCRKDLRKVDRWVIDRILISVDLIKRVMECLSVRRSIYCVAEIEAFLKEDVGSLPPRTPPSPSKATPKPQPKPEKDKQPEAKEHQETQTHAQPAQKPAQPVEKESPKVQPQTPPPQKPEPSLDKESAKAPQTDTPLEEKPVEKEAAPIQPPPQERAILPDIHEKADSGQHRSMSLEKSDHLVDLLGEMLVIQSQVEMEAQNRLPNGDPLLNIIARMCHVGREIQNFSMTMRKIPIQAIFDEISRSNPDWPLDVDGNDTLIDLQMVEQIEAFLSRWIAHLMKNKTSDEDGFFDSPTDTISFRCSDHGQFTLLECFIPKTLIGDSQTDHELLPAPLLDDLKTMGAKIDTQHKGDATQPLAIKLPSQQTIMNGTILKIMGTAYVIPTMHVKQIYQPKAEDWLSVKGQEEMIKIRGQIIPVIPIYTIFQSHQHQSRLPDLPSESPLVMILEWEKQYMALPVEDVMDRREIAVKPMDHQFQELDFVLGASILGDGKVALILDVECFFQHLHDSKKIQEEKR